MPLIFSDVLPIWRLAIIGRSVHRQSVNMLLYGSKQILLGSASSWDSQGMGDSRLIMQLNGRAK